MSTGVRKFPVWRTPGYSLDTETLRLPIRKKSIPPGRAWCEHPLPVPFISFLLGALVWEFQLRGNSENNPLLSSPTFNFSHYLYSEVSPSSWRRPPFPEHNVFHSLNTVCLLDISWALFTISKRALLHLLDPVQVQFTTIFILWIPSTIHPETWGSSSPSHIQSVLKFYPFHSWNLPNLAMPAWKRKKERKERREGRKEGRKALL